MASEKLLVLAENYARHYNMKHTEIDYIIKQTLIEASLHHEEDRQRYYNAILDLANRVKYLEGKFRDMVSELNKDPI